MQKRQTRRQSYVGFLQEGNELSTLLRQTRELFTWPPADRDEERIAEAFERINSLFRSLQNHRASIALEGTKKLLEYADRVLLHASQMKDALRDWRFRYRHAAVPGEENTRVESMERMTAPLYWFELAARRHL
ncbi:hypothetical protein ACF05W_32560 [Streptomyces lydicus]|uniref:hypothetical protein n=1 Tax=Streptomyces lydicus TaxID=47763 RepID=UPI0037029675